MVSHDSIQDFNAIPMLGVVPEEVTSDPVSGLIDGRIWTRTDLHVIKAYLNSIAKVLATTDDTRFTDSRPPNGAAGGDLSGTYPNPTIGNNKVTLAMLALAVIQNGLSSGTAATTDAALRRLGFTTHDSMPGTARLDQIAVPTTNLVLNSQGITGMADPSNPQDAATKAYVDSVAQGLDAKASVRVKSTANVVIASALENGDSIDGVTLVTGNRVLLANQSSASENGIYVVSASGTAARASDMNSAGEFAGAFVFVEEGTQADTGWVCTTNEPVSIGTSPINWAQFSSAGAYTAGAGLALTGLDFSVNVDSSSIEINSDTLRVKALGITNAMIAAATIDLTAKVTGLLPIANGGTNASTAAGARTNLGVPGAFAGTSPALTAGTYADVVHSLGVRAKSVTFVTATGENNATLDWRNKSGAETSTIQIKTDIVGGRASAFYNVYVVA